MPSCPTDRLNIANTSLVVIVIWEEINHLIIGHRMNVGEANTVVFQHALVVKYATYEKIVEFLNVLQEIFTLCSILGDSARYVQQRRPHLRSVAHGRTEVA